MAKKKVRYDVLINPTNRIRRFPDGALDALLKRLEYAGTAIHDERVFSDKGADYYMTPGPAAHEAFFSGTYEGPLPVFKELIVHYSDVPEEHTYGFAKRSACLSLEFLGCTFKEPRGGFLKLLRVILNIRPEVISRKHTEMPPHRTAPVEENTAEITIPEHQISGGNHAGSIVTEYW